VVSGILEEKDERVIAEYVMQQEQYIEDFYEEKQNDLISTAPVFKKDYYFKPKEIEERKRLKEGRKEKRSYK